MTTRCRPEVYVAVAEPALRRALPDVLESDGFDVTEGAARVDLQELLWTVEEEIVEAPDVIVVEDAVISRAELTTIKRLCDEDTPMFVLLIVGSDESAERAAAMGLHFLYMPADVDDVRTVVQNAGFLNGARTSNSGAHHRRRHRAGPSVRLRSVA